METARSLTKLLRETARPISSIEQAAIDDVLDRIGDASVVLLGEATHGTSEFYRMRARITQQLIARRKFRLVAVEADWPDAAHVHDYVQGGLARVAPPGAPFQRFPTWMWRNQEVLELVEWLRAYNAEHPRQPAGFYGLDLYSLFTSISAVLTYLDRVDPNAAAIARERYGVLMPWQHDPAAYGHAVLLGAQGSCEREVIAMLREMLERQLEYAAKDGERFFDAAQNARLIANAERYYRAMYYGGAASWNLRDSHMFDTLHSLLAYHEPGAKCVVWAHNSHVGDARATQMASHGEHNLGQLCRVALGQAVYIIGFGTDHGTVAAASHWGEPMRLMNVRPARPDSYEGLCHETGIAAFSLPLRDTDRRELRDELGAERLERAIGVVYRPETERESHYFYASLPQQLDEYIWFDETRAVRPLSPQPAVPRNDRPDVHPLWP